MDVSSFARGPWMDREELQRRMLRDEEENARAVTRSTASRCEPYVM